MNGLDRNRAVEVGNGLAKVEPVKVRYETSPYMERLDRPGSAGISAVVPASFFPTATFGVVPSFHDDIWSLNI